MRVDCELQSLAGIVINIIIIMSVNEGTGETLWRMSDGVFYLVSPIWCLLSGVSYLVSSIW